MNTAQTARLSPGMSEARDQRGRRSSKPERFGTWTLTDGGIECSLNGYAIPFGRLREPDWPEHVTAKSWCVPEDFYAAYDAALSILSRPKPGTRFQVLKRDGYRCRLCGATASEGARLEVDHRVPRATGGRDTLDNLWTLCFDCNRGKSARPL